MKISVCMATYNGEKYIRQQIKSILNQIGEDDELIISDDHSADDTLKIIKSFNDDRIKIYLNEHEKGYTKNFENAMKKSSGDIIFLSDQDDVWNNNKVNIMLNKLKNADMVVSDAEVVDENLKTIYTSHFKLCKVKQGFWENFLKTRYIGACMAFNRNVLEKALPFPKNQVYCAHDYWLTNVAEAFFKVELEHNALIKYRRHSSNASNGGQKSSTPIKKRLLIRIYTMFNLISRYTIN